MKIYQATSVVWLTALVATLTACGGGGGSDATNTTITTPVVTAPITTPVTGTITTPVTGPITTAALTLEVEPNNGSVANPLTLSVPLTGQLSSATDQDWYAVTAASSGTITINFSSASPNFGGWKYSIRDAANNTLSSVICIVDKPCSSQTLSTGIPSAGIYYLVVEIGTTRHIVETSNYSITATTTTSNAAIEMETNNVSSTATPIATSIPLTGQLSSAIDQDWYAVTAASAGKITMSVSSVRPYFGGWKYSIRDAANNTLSSVACTADNPCSSQTLSAGIPVAGTYYLVVEVGTTRYIAETDSYILSFNF